MVAHVLTVAFRGLEVVPIDVQVKLTPGMPAFTIVGLPDKSVGESRERVRAALSALGLALPPKRITVNLSPTDLVKEGNHFDLPIALGVLASLGVVPGEVASGYFVLGELSLDGALNRVSGVLPVAAHAASMGFGIVCPEVNGGEAAWGGFQEIDVTLEDDEAAGRRKMRRNDIVAAPSLLALINHLRGVQRLAEPPAKIAEDAGNYPDLLDVKGQETAKRALEVAAAGGHNLVMMGPPGAGKSMLAARLPGLMPPLEPSEALDVSMIHSMAGLLETGKLIRRRPFRDPHHTATAAALIGGGTRVRPGEISLAHHGVLFLDELPEFNRLTLEALRQPLETGQVVLARANGHISFPSRVQVVAALNPCKCGYADDPARACSRAPRCSLEYQGRISGPLYDRMDLFVDVPAVSAANLTLSPPSEASADVALRVAQARKVQRERFAQLSSKPPSAAKAVRTNAQADGQALAAIATPDALGQALLDRAMERLGLSARGYHRVLRVARTLADLDGSDAVRRLHIAEALSWRRPVARQTLAA